MARWSATSASSLWDEGGSAVRLRAFATNVSARRRASCTRCCHCSRVRVEAGKLSISCARHCAADANSDHTTSRSRVRFIMVGTSQSSADQTHQHATLTAFIAAATGAQRNPRPAEGEQASRSKFLQRVRKSPLLRRAKLFDLSKQQRSHGLGSSQIRAGCSAFKATSNKLLEFDKNFFSKRFRGDRNERYGNYNSTG